MPATKFTSIPTHAAWKKARDGAGGKSGLCSKVNIGKLLDAFDKARKVKERTAALEALKVGFVHYTADKKVKAIKDLHDTAMSIFTAITKEQLAMKQSRDVGLAIGLKIGDGLKRLATIAALLKEGKLADAGLTYEKFWDGIGRGVGQQLSAGKLRDGWTKVHNAQPDRSAIGNAKSDEKKKQLIESGSAAYKQALNDLLKDAQAEGLEVKLG